MNSIEEDMNSFKIGLKDDKNDSNLRYTMPKHVGGVVESIIRRKGHNISKLARNMKVSRCTLYNWFEQETLPFDVLVRIGSFIDYDFSTDFPEIFVSTPNKKEDDRHLQYHLTENEKVDFWIRKYILLLEKYNDSLLNKNFLQERSV